MDPVVDRLTALEKKLDETHRLVVKIRRAQRQTMYSRIIYWGFLLLAGFGAFYFLEPYLTTLKDMYTGIGGTIPQGQVIDYATMLRDLTK